MTEPTPDTPESEQTGDGLRSDDRRIASTDYGAWIEVECTHVCGWKPEKQASIEAVRHFKATGHETAVTRHSSIHYHARRD